MKNHINILDLCERTKQLGPGMRYAIWVQGCPFHCVECITPEGIPIVPNALLPIDAIVNSVCDDRDLTGITISGGEPFIQASKLYSLLSAIREIRPELDVIVFTGFQLKQLNWPEAKDLLSIVDVLIDGLYVEKLNDNRGLRGSSNQEIHFLTNRLAGHKDYFHNRPRSLEVYVQNEFQRTVGIPNREIKL